MPVAYSVEAPGNSLEKQGVGLIYGMALVVVKSPIDCPLLWSKV